MKEKAITMEYGDQDHSYNEVPRWLLAAQQTNHETIFQLFGPPVNVDGSSDRRADKMPLPLSVIRHRFG